MDRNSIKRTELYFDRPAEKWEEAFPIGNGRMGAMVFAGTGQERMQLNEDSIWYGGPEDRLNPDAFLNLPEVRRLILSGKIPEAEELLARCFSGLPQSQRPYQSAGELMIGYNEQSVKDGVSRPEGMTVTDYCRRLNLEEGIVYASYRQGDCLITREYFASYPSQVIVIHLNADDGKSAEKNSATGGALSFSLMLSRGRYYDRSGRKGTDTIWLEGNLGKGGSDFILAVKACAREGKVYAQGETLCVEGAKEVTLYLAMETSFYRGEEYRNAAFDRLEKAADLGYEAVKRAHLEDYRALYGRVSLRLGKKEEEDFSGCRTEELLRAAGASGLQDGADAADGPDDDRKCRRLAEIYFQYGRYLLISCSRPGSQPATLQGIWNESMTPNWESKYTININTEMNYWPAEICDLPECHLPLFDMLKRMQPRGQKAAREMYGCRGFMAHHNTDIWADCAPQDIYIPATYWEMGAAWLATHIWTHYLYTKDEKFLEEMYPVLEDAVLFFHDFLIMDKGEAVTCPSVSPENTYILPDGTRGRGCAGASMDTQILRDLFNGYLKASSVLGKASDRIERTRELLGLLPPFRIGKHGQIMEWREDYEEEEPGHRHISQLYALHPSHQITLDKTPELAQAAERTLERRLRYGGGHTGWSCAWIVNFYARLGKGNQAWENLRKLWRNSTFKNLMDNHPVENGHLFQIDGNLGATAAIAELLIQSDEERTILLPALPDCWPDGEATGLKIPGDAKLSIVWENGKLLNCRVSAGKKDLDTRLVYEGKSVRVSLKAGEARIWNA